MKRNGFTLIELMFTLSVIVVLSLLGSSSYTHLIQKNEQQTMIDELSAAVHYAKMQAIILGHPVYLTALDTELNWAKGMALSSFDKKTKKTQLLYQWQWNHPNWRVSWSGMSSDSQVSFSNNTLSAISNGHFTLVNFSTHTQVILILNRLGRLRIDS